MLKLISLLCSTSTQLPLRRIKSSHDNTQSTVSRGIVSVKSATVIEKINEIDPNTLKKIMEFSDIYFRAKLSKVYIC